MERRGERTPTEFDSTPTLAELATRQGVRPVENLTSILGPEHPDEGDSVDDFLHLLSDWRREGAERAPE